jgi:hypothetical protein
MTHSANHAEHFPQYALSSQGSESISGKHLPAGAAAKVGGLEKRAQISSAIHRNRLWSKYANPL